MKIYIILQKESNSVSYAVLSALGHVYFRGNSYQNKYRAKRGVMAFQRAVSDPYKYLQMKNAFILRAGNYREIGRSPKMKPDQLKEAMALLIKYGADAPIVSDNDPIHDKPEKQHDLRAQDDESK